LWRYALSILRQANRRISNIESSSGGQVSKDGIASGFAFGYDPTGRSFFLKIDRIHYSMFDVGRWMFDVH
jgi:hypothetical protein